MAKSDKRAAKSRSITESVVEPAESNVLSDSSIVTAFTNYYELGIDEKLYLQCDKPYYSAGEQIWFKGYLLNAITLQRLMFTNFIYVELLRADGELVSRVKVRREPTGFNGYITLDPTMEAGDYTLRGYTRWMMNNDDEFFFAKSIKIVTPIPVTEGESEAEQLSRREKIKREEAETEARNRAEARKLDYDVQFFPEGGTFIKQAPQFVAFKSVAEDGLSRYVKGSIYNSAGEEITQIETTHKGMGLFMIIPIEGESYYAITKSLSGVEKRFDLPTVESVGVSLQLSYRNKQVLFQARATDAKLLNGASVVIHSQGRIISVAPLRSSVHIFSEEQLFDGISVISLVSARGKIMAERLVFKKPDGQPILSIESSANNYRRRERVNVSVEVRDSSGDPAQGEFGVSVVDSSTVNRDEESDNILSYLLLSSEIRGYIEDPALYFAQNGVEERYHLDLLMRTQGWRRFNLEEVLTHRVPKRMIPYEEGDNISGRVEGFFGNDARSPELSIFCSQPQFMDVVTLDSSSRFNIVDLDIPDSVTYVLQARGRRGGSALSLIIDSVNYPKAKASVVDRGFEEYIPVAFVSQSQDKFFYEGGMNMINIDAVEVTAKKEAQSSVSSFAAKSSTRADLERYTAMPFQQLVLMYPSMQVSDEGITYRNESSYARILVNGFDYDIDEALTLTSDDIEQIEFFYGPAAAIYTNSSGGVFNITLREDYGGNKFAPLNMAYVSRLGYQQAAEYYQPKYDDPSLKDKLPPDYRTTLYWNGRLTPDKDGIITFDFFTADKATIYEVIVEGVTYDGEICQGAATIERTLAH